MGYVHHFLHIIYNQTNIIVLLGLSTFPFSTAMKLSKQEESNYLIHSVIQVWTVSPMKVYKPVVREVYPIQPRLH